MTQEQKQRNYKEFLNGDIKVQTSCATKTQLKHSHIILLPFYESQVNRVLKCDVIILQIFPLEPLNLVMRYTQLL